MSLGMPDAVTSVLATALDGLANRQNVIADNIANVDTPGFRATSVDFESSLAAALQRVGRAGHSLEATSRGVFVPTFRDDALEQLAILDAMRSGDVEPTRVVQNALDASPLAVVAS